MKEIKILTPVGMLGYGFPVEDYQRGLEHEPDAVILDSGSTDPGPYMLGTGTTMVKPRAYVRDLKVILEEIGDKKIDVIKAVREFTSLGLGEAKALVEAKGVIKENATKEEADKIIARFKEVGATVVAE